MSVKYYPSVIVCLLCSTSPVLVSEGGCCKKRTQEMLRPLRFSADVCLAVVWAPRGWSGGARGSRGAGRRPCWKGRTSNPRPSPDREPGLLPASSFPREPGGCGPPGRRRRPGLRHHRHGLPSLRPSRAPLPGGAVLPFRTSVGYAAFFSFPFFSGARAVSVALGIHSLEKKQEKKKSLWCH